MKQVRLGVIGCGGMARAHMRYFESIPGLKFTAAADNFSANLDMVTAEHGVEGFTDGMKLIKSGSVDAIMICTPHYFHPDLSIAGMKAGLHVLTEKPVAVTAHEAARVEKVHAKYPKLVYAAMFQIRAHPLWQRIHRTLHNGELGCIQRVNWIVTNWFRTMAYYNQAEWRATWKGEGGGVLLNQCPHNLDLLCWLLGSPSEVRAFLSLGKYHHIEVEDEVTAYMTWDGQKKGLIHPKGATGVFVTTTGESPGTDRLEIVGDRGKLVLENGKLSITQTHESVMQFCVDTEEAFGQPGKDDITIATGGDDPGHRVVTANFIQAIQKPGTPLICSGESALPELELGNAMLYSGLINESVKIPMKRAAFDKHLKDLIAKSKFKKGAVRKAKVDMDKSFH